MSNDAKTVVHDFTTDPNNPANMPELEIEVVDRKKWSTRTKVAAALIAVLAVCGIVMISVAHMPDDGVTTTQLPVPETAPAPTAPVTDEAAPVVSPPPRMPAKGVMVAAVDFTTCKTFATLTLANGNKRVVGNDCAPIPAVSAKAAAASETVAKPAIDTTETAEQVTSEETQKTVETVTAVTEAVLEDLRDVSEEPEGAIDTSELQTPERTE